MQILLSPQRSDQNVTYSFNGEIITCVMEGESDTFDFSSVPDGEAVVSGIETELPVNPIVSAKRVNGELFVKLLNFIKRDVTSAELFPEWQVIGSE